MTYDEFKKKFNITLNSQQEKAVLRAEGQTLLLAVPGSGKTTVITARLGYMIFCMGINPHKILTMTYTVAATDDMRRRFAQRFGTEYASELEFRTINALCAAVIRYYERKMDTRAFELVASDSETSKLIREICLSLGGEYPSESDVKDVRTMITYCKNMMLSDGEAEKLELDRVDFFKIYSGYRLRMRRERKMDFDDQLVYAYSILRRYPDILAYFRGRYNYINVDEAQDTSRIQHMIIRLLAGDGGNLFMVGDEDQSIYGFRAAWPQALLEFDRVFPEGEVLLMETNYRCTGTITGRADMFIKRNTARREKTMRTVNPKGAEIKHTVLSDRSEQYKYLAALAASGGETAVLYRNNDSALPIIDLFDKKGIAYKCTQTEGLFFTHYIVCDIIDTIKFAFDQSDGELFMKLYYKFGCGLKKNTAAAAVKRHGKSRYANVIDAVLSSPGLESWTAAKLRTLKSHFGHLCTDTSFGAVNRIVNYMGYGDYLRSRQADMSRVNIMLALASENPGMMDFIARLRELPSVVAAGGDKKSNFVLSTIHSSKGLEYDKVVLIDIADGIFPSIPEPGAGDVLTKEEKAQLEEERRLFYVGVTRARKELEIVSCKKDYGALTKPVSSFITAMLPPRPERKPAERKINNGYVLVPPPKCSEGSKKFVPGAAVKHKVFGRGEILELRNGIISVKFTDGSIKRLVLENCLDRRLLTTLGKENT